MSSREFNAESRLAAAAAASGDPTALLALDTYVEPREPPGPVVGRLLSVNVGVPRNVAWEGKTVRTAIWKKPVGGPRMVRKINIDGDDQADRAAHGGEHRAVFVYQIESYRYWERELRRHDFSYGQFGENFTVQGLADDEVCIGDRYQIGQAVFEVTQPRVTCFRVGIRMREPRMPSLLVAHHRPGFYFRVLREGQVEADDEIILLERGPQQVTVADIDGLLYLPNRSRRLLQRALGIPALSEGWKGSFRSLAEQGEPTERPVSAAAWEGFRPLTVTAVTRESSTITSITLSPGPDQAAAVAIPGQYLTFRLRPGGPGEPPVIRSYSLSSITPGGYRVSVKLEPGGVGSAFMHQHVHPGDVLDVAAPRGDFVLRERDCAAVLISAGVGATPVLAMLRALAEAGSTREVWWFHGAHDRRQHAFGHEVDELLAALPHAHRVVAYSRLHDGEAPGGGFDLSGRISVETITQAGVPADADYYLCGPDGFMREISAGLTARGVLPERVATEIFGAKDIIAPGVTGDRPAPHPPDGAPGDGPAITFSRSGLTVPWDTSYPSLLEFAEACDVPASFSCRTGVCHYCETGLLSGEVDYTTTPLEPPAEGRLLVCCSQPATDVTLEL
jgi:ferredoxin-NADP reductase/MOSC domain-containing protein YiiM